MSEPRTGAEHEPRNPDEWWVGCVCGNNHTVTWWRSQWAGRAVQDDGLPPGLDVEKLHAEIHDPEWQAQDGCHDAVERLLAALSELHQHARTQPHGPDCDRDNCYVMAAPPLHDPQEPERG